MVSVLDAEANAVDETTNMTILFVATVTKKNSFLIPKYQYR